MVTISVPSSLASFASSRASSSKTPHVSLSPVDGSNGKLGVAAVQGDGVWTYDLVSLRPVSTYTVPPSTRFAGPALSYIIQPPSPLANGVGKGKGKERQVEEEAVAEMMESMDVDGAEEAELSSSVDSGEEPVQPSGPVRRTMVPVLSNEKGEVWVWDGEDGAEKVVIQLDTTARFLHRIPESPYPVLAIHTPSRLSLIGPRHTVHPITAPSSSSSAHIVASRVIPFDAASSGLITVTETGQVTSLRIEHPEDGAPSLRVTSESSIPLGSSIPTKGDKGDKVDTPKKGRGKGSHGSAVRVSSADIGPDGLVALITSAGAMITYDTRTSTVVQSSMPLAPPATGSAIALISSPAGPKSICLHPVAKSANASASLIATLSSASPAVLGAADIASILPTDYSSVQHLSVLAQGSKGRSVVGVVAWHPTQSSGTPSQAGHGKDKDASAEKGGRSIVHLVEVDAPARSVGMNALLGSAAATARYLVTPAKADTAPAANGDAPSAPAPAPVATVLATLLAATNRSADQWTQVLLYICSPKGATIPSSQLAHMLKLAIADERIEEVYKAVLDLPPPDLAFRLELRRQLGAEEGNVLLGLLLQWTEAVQEHDEGVKWDEEAVSTPTKPSMPQILTHTSILLDSLLPLLITYEPFHPHLASLSESLGPMLDQQRTLTQLRAPIDALLTLAKREERKRALIREKRAAMRGGNADEGAEGQDVKGKMREGERTRMNRGTGQAGRLALGGDVGLWSVEDFDF